MSPDYKLIKSLHEFITGCDELAVWIHSDDTGYKCRFCGQFMKNDYGEQLVGPHPGITNFGIHMRYCATKFLKDTKARPDYESILACMELQNDEK